MVTLFANTHDSRAGSTEYHHIPAFPFWVGVVRIVQCVLALLLLILAAYALSVLGGWDGPALTIFTCIWTWITNGYILFTAWRAPNVYNCWAHLALEVLAVIFWLCSWAVCAADAAAWAGFDYYWGYYGKGSGSAAVGCVKALAGLGALQWLLFIATLVFFGLALHRMRLDGNPNGVRYGAGGVEAAGGNHKMEPVGAQPVGAEQPAMGQHYGNPPVGQHYTEQPVTGGQHYTEQPIQGQHYNNPPV